MVRERLRFGCGALTAVLFLAVFFAPGFAGAEGYGAESYGANEYGVATTPAVSSGGSAASRSLAAGTTATTSPSRADLERQITELLAQLKMRQVGQMSNFLAGQTFLVNLKVGSTGQDVLALQKFLNANGFVVNSKPAGAGAPGLESTFFGEMTREALARFQHNNAIAPAVGFFGPVTRALVNKLLSP